jgi:hypothetical protein
VWLYYWSGTTLGALSTGVLVVLLGGLLSAVASTIRWSTAATVVLALCVVSITGKTPTCEVARMIPQRDIVETRIRRSVFWFGYELGTGLRTHASTMAPHAVVIVVSLLTPSPVAVAIAAVCFACGRSATALVLVLRRERNSRGKPLGLGRGANAFGTREQLLTAASLAALVVVAR